MAFRTLRKSRLRISSNEDQIMNFFESFQRLIKLPFHEEVIIHFNFGTNCTLIKLLISQNQNLTSVTMLSLLLGYKYRSIWA